MRNLKKKKSFLRTFTVPQNGKSSGVCLLYFAFLHWQHEFGIQHQKEDDEEERKKDKGKEMTGAG